MRKFCLFMVCLIIPSFAQAADEVDFIKKYFSDFDAGNSLINYFTQRPQFLFNLHFHIPDDATSANNFMLERRKKMESIDYGKSVVVGSQIIAHLKAYSLTTVKVDRFTKDGKPMDSACHTFGIFKTKFGYRILSWQQTEPDAKGQCSQFVEPEKGHVHSDHL